MSELHHQPIEQPTTQSTEQTRGQTTGQPAKQSAKQPANTRKAASFVGMGGWLLESLLAVLLVIVFVANVVHISGNSMTPTLSSGEYLLVSKLEGWLTHFGVQPLQRGDIIYFRSPHTNSNWWHSDNLYIKRVIGLPGDSVQIINDQVLVNGTPLTEPYTRGESRFDMAEMYVPEGHYFVMGDNRVPLGSSDSRHFGTIPMPYVRGRALLVVFPWWRSHGRNLRVIRSPNYTNN